MRGSAPRRSADDLRTLLRPYDESLMEAYAVSRKVNSVKNDTEECIEPIDDRPGMSYPTQDPLEVPSRGASLA